MGRDSNLDLNTSEDLPESDVSTTGGTEGAAAPVAALKRGFTKVDAVDLNRHDEVRQDDDGTNYTGGNPVDKGGFLDRPQGWER